MFIDSGPGSSGHSGMTSGELIGGTKALPEGEAAVDDDRLAGDHRAAGAQEKDRLGDVFGLAGALQWRALDRGALRSAGQSLFHGLSTKPGATALTRISGARVRARLRVRLMRPALLVA